MMADGDHEETLLECRRLALRVMAASWPPGVTEPVGPYTIERAPAEQRLFLVKREDGRPVDLISPLNWRAATALGDYFHDLLHSDPDSVTLNDLESKQFGSAGGAR